MKQSDLANLLFAHVGKTLYRSDVGEILRKTRDGVDPEGGLPRQAEGTYSAHQESSKPHVPILTSAFSTGFKFGAASLKELEGVNVRLAMVATHALNRYSTQDFCVFDGIRTHKEQAEHVAKGNSRTMKSKHLDGLAVDLVPWINGKPVWDWVGCYKIAYAMDQAATELGIADKIRWGGAWDRTLADFGGDLGSYEQEVQLYRSRHAGSDFIDGPHFEWVS